MFAYEKFNELADLIPFTLRLYKLMLEKNRDSRLYVTGEYVYNLLVSKQLPKTILLKGTLSTDDVLTLCRIHDISCTSRGNEILMLNDDKRFVYSRLLGGDIKQDAMSRDFTINTIYVNVETLEATDPLNAAEDIERNALKACVSPYEVFSRQPSSILNMVRLVCEQRLSVSDEMLNAAKDNAQFLRHENTEAIRNALFAVILSDTSKTYEGMEITGENSPVLLGLMLFRELDIFKYAIPELEVGRGMEQKRRYHKYDVQEHMIRTCVATPPKLYMRLAGLFHDSGKPEAYAQNNGKNMHGHDRIGAGIAKTTLRRLRCRDDIINKVCRIIAIHMYDIAGIAKEVTLRKRFAQWGYSLTQDIIDFRYSDVQGSGCEDRSTKSANRFAEIFEQMQLENTPFSIYDLKITGREISLALNLHNGTDINAVKRELLRHCANNPEDNTPVRLMELVKTMEDMRLPVIDECE